MKTKTSFGGALCALSLACSNAIANTSVPVSIDVQTIQNTVSPNFLSVAFDSAQHMEEINFWDDEGVVNLKQKALVNLAKQLSPGYLRIGGTDADNMYYQVGEQKKTEKPAQFGGTLTQKQAKRIFKFADKTGLDVYFDVNAGNSTRDSAGNWDTSNSDALQEFVDEKDFDVSVWELSNEPGLYPTFHPGEEINPSDLADSYVTFKGLKDEDELLVGPSEAWFPLVGEASLTADPVNNIDHLYPANLVAVINAMGAHIRPTSYLADFLSAMPEDTLDALTWHYYPQQSERCYFTVPATSPDIMLNPQNLNEIKTWISQVRDLRDTYQPGAEIWMGETGNAQCGGQAGVSDRFASSFWWLDELGVLAQNDNDVAVRQTLMGSEYGIIDKDTLKPRSDYWASVLWKMTMGEEVLAVTQNTEDQLRVYSHCHADDPDSLTVLAINLNASEAYDMESAAWEGKSVSQYTMTADSLSSSTVSINGTMMDTNRNGTFTIPTNDYVAGETIAIQPHSISFVQIQNANAQACSND